MDSIINLLQSAEFGLALVLVVPIILGLVQAIKKVCNLQDDQYDRWKPLISILVGVFLMTIMLIAKKFPSTGEWIVTAIVGIVLGLAASGLYTAQKAMRG